MRSWRWRRRCRENASARCAICGRRGWRDGTRRGGARRAETRASRGGVAKSQGGAKAGRGGCATRGGDGEETCQEGGEEVERFRRRARKSRTRTRGNPRRRRRAAAASAIVVEIGKFALPAVIAWFARQPTINELRLNLEAMTAAKARADEEASKIRAKLVELRKRAGARRKGGRRSEDRG